MKNEGLLQRFQYWYLFCVCKKFLKRTNRFSWCIAFLNSVFSHYGFATWPLGTVINEVCCLWECEVLTLIWWVLGIDSVLECVYSLNFILFVEDKCWDAMWRIRSVLVMFLFMSSSGERLGEPFMHRSCTCVCLCARACASPERMITLDEVNMQKQGHSDPTPLTIWPSEGRVLVFTCRLGAVG